MYLPDVNFPDSLQPVASLGAALTRIAVDRPGRAVARLAAVLHEAAPRIHADALVVSATKGLEEHTLLRMSEVIAAGTAARAASVAVLSGPSFAAELARELPTAVVVASHDQWRASSTCRQEFRSSALRLYGSADVVGVEIGGALKNIIAIAAGVVEGLGLGHNALAALITRGLAEITRLAVALGAQRDTLAGLAGLGDLVLTCTGTIESQPTRRRRARARPQRSRRFSPARRWWPKACAPRSAALALGAPSRRRAADRRADGRRARRPPRSEERGLRADGTTADKSHE